MKPNLAEAREPDAEPDVEPSSDSIDALLTRVEKPAAAPAPADPVQVPAPRGMRAARVVALKGRVATIAARGGGAESEADVAPEVELDLIRRTMEERGLVLVEGGPRPEVIGVLQTRAPANLKLTADTIEIEAKRELTLRAGRAAVRLREDGDIEVVGSRIYAASRGLFKIVGRMLRLN